MRLYAAVMKLCREASKRPLPWHRGRVQAGDKVHAKRRADRTSGSHSACCLLLLRRIYLSS